MSPYEGKLSLDAYKMNYFTYSFQSVISVLSAMPYMEQENEKSRKHVKQQVLRHIYYY